MNSHKVAAHLSAAFAFISALSVAIAAGPPELNFLGPQLAQKIIGFSALLALICRIVKTEVLAGNVAAANDGTLATK